MCPCTSEIGASKAAGRALSGFSGLAPSVGRGPLRCSAPRVSAQTRPRVPGLRHAHSGAFAPDPLRLRFSAAPIHPTNALPPTLRQRLQRSAWWCAYPMCMTEGARVRGRMCVGEQRSAARGSPAHRRRTGEKDLWAGPFRAGAGFIAAALAERAAQRTRAKGEGDAPEPAHPGAFGPASKLRTTD